MSQLDHSQASDSSTSAAKRPPLEDAPPLSAGARFRDAEAIGRGGAGIVYRAFDEQRGEVVAIKRLRGRAREAQTAIERFRREARIVSRLRHPNVVDVQEVIEEDDDILIVMELVDGDDLERRIRSGGPFPQRDAFAIAERIARGLVYAHDNGIIHRDVKPANVILGPSDDPDDPGVPKIVDFGLARAPDPAGSVGSLESLTGDGALLGTIDYMAPEQARDPRKADARADVYSLGALLYRLLTGESPRTIREGRLPEASRYIVMRALEDDRERRYPDMAAFRESLESGLSFFAPGRASSQATTEAKPTDPAIDALVEEMAEEMAKIADLDPFEETATRADAPPSFDPFADWNEEDDELGGSLATMFRGFGGIEPSRTRRIEVVLALLGLESNELQGESAEVVGRALLRRGIHPLVTATVLAALERPPALVPDDELRQRLITIAVAKVATLGDGRFETHTKKMDLACATNLAYRRLLNAALTNPIVREDHAHGGRSTRPDGDIGLVMTATTFAIASHETGELDTRAARAELAERIDRRYRSLLGLIEEGKLLTSTEGPLRVELDVIDDEKHAALRRLARASSRGERLQVESILRDLGIHGTVDTDKALAFFDHLVENEIEPADALQIILASQRRELERRRQSTPPTPPPTDATDPTWATAPTPPEAPIPPAATLAIGDGLELGRLALARASGRVFPASLAAGVAIALYLIAAVALPGPLGLGALAAGFLGLVTIPFAARLGRAAGAVVPGLLAGAVFAGAALAAPPLPAERPALGLALGAGVVGAVAIANLVGVWRDRRELAERLRGVERRAAWLDT